MRQPATPVTDPWNGLTTPRLNVQAAVDALGSESGGTPTITSPAPGSTLPEDERNLPHGAV